MDDKRIINLNLNVSMTYEELKKALEQFVKQAKTEGVDIKSRLVYNEKAGTAEVLIMRNTK